MLKWIYCHYMPPDRIDESSIVKFERLNISYGRSSLHNKILKILLALKSRLKHSKTRRENNFSEGAEK